MFFFGKCLCPYINCLWLDYFTFFIVSKQMTCPRNKNAIQGTKKTLDIEHKKSEANR